MKDFNLLAITLLCLFTFNCNSQNQTKEIKDKFINRQPVFAGQFYPGDPEELISDLKILFFKALTKSGNDEVLGLICPHAGYVYSGEVAATSYNQLDLSKKYENIFILAPSHRSTFNGASIYSTGNFITPLGEVKVNIDLAKELIKKSKYLNDQIDGHNQEHSIEVQLPFLQYILKSEYQIIPISFGTQSATICKEIAQVLKPYLNEKNLFIISSDFSHYPEYEVANKVDSCTGGAIETKSGKKLLNALDKNMNEKDPNLATSICGFAPMLTLLYMVEDNRDFKINKIQYKNSGDSPQGRKDQVVGYWSMSVTMPKKDKTPEGYNLNDEDKKMLIKIARETLDEYIKSGNKPQIDTASLSKTLTTACGAFVTLTKNSQLRGCIGQFTPTEPLFKVVQEMVIAAAENDYRFSKVTSKELDKIEIEISVLTPLKKIKSIDEIEIGRHGIYIKKGNKAGTFLPQVAKETGWSKEEFLGQCASQKAGLSFDGWKDADIFTYEAIVFYESSYYAKNKK